MCVSVVDGGELGISETTNDEIENGGTGEAERYLDEETEGDGEIVRERATIAGTPRRSETPKEGQRQESSTTMSSIVVGTERVGGKDTYRGDDISGGVGE